MCCRHKACNHIASFTMVWWIQHPSIWFGGKGELLGDEILREDSASVQGLNSLRPDTFQRERWSVGCYRSPPTFTLGRSRRRLWLRQPFTLAMLYVGKSLGKTVMMGESEGSRKRARLNKRSKAVNLWAFLKVIGRVTRSWKWLTCACTRAHTEYSFCFQTAHSASRVASSR